MKKQINTKKQFLEFFDSYYREIYQYIYTRLGYSKETAEDLTQEIFIKCWDKRATYDPDKASLRTWLYRISHNHLIDYLRRKQVEINLQEADLTQQISPDVAEAIQIQLNVAEVLHQIQQMAEKDKNLILLRYVQLLDIAEIAQIMDMELSATKVAIHRALQRLRNKINEAK